MCVGIAKLTLYILEKTTSVLREDWGKRDLKETALEEYSVSVLYSMHSIPYRGNRKPSASKSEAILKLSKMATRRKVDWPTNNYLEMVTRKNIAQWQTTGHN
jgi:hypothetical protein